MRSVVVVDVSASDNVLGTKVVTELREARLAWLYRCCCPRSVLGIRSIDSVRAGDEWFRASKTSSRDGCDAVR